MKSFDIIIYNQFIQWIVNNKYYLIIDLGITENIFLNKKCEKEKGLENNFSQFWETELE